MRALAFLVCAKPCRLTRNLLPRFWYQIILRCRVPAYGNLYCL